MCNIQEENPSGKCMGKGEGGMGNLEGGMTKKDLLRLFGALRMSGEVIHNKPQKPILGIFMKGKERTSFHSTSDPQRY